MNDFGWDAHPFGLEGFQMVQAAREHGRIEERAKIVEWLSASDDKKMQLEHWAIAALIKDGEHLK